MGIEIDLTLWWRRVTAVRPCAHELVLIESDVGVRLLREFRIETRYAGRREEYRELQKSEVGTLVLSRSKRTQEGPSYVYGYVGVGTGPGQRRSFHCET